MHRAGRIGAPAIAGTIALETGDKGGRILLR